MIIYISEIIGTFIYLFLTFSIIGNAVSNKESTNTTLLITSLGVGLSYLVPCIIFGDISGGHFNPAITIATALLGIFERRFMCGYIISQAIGSFFAAAVYVTCFYENIVRCIDAKYKVKMLVVDSPNKNFAVLFIKETFATFLLLFSMLAVTFILKGVTTESVYVLYFLILVAIGLAFDYTTVVTNPFRDLFMRLIFLPIVFKQKFKILYIIVTILAPILGAILAVLVFNIIPWEQ